jgi:hypothetical protein
MVLQGESYRGDAYASAKSPGSSANAMVTGLPQVEEGISSFGELIYTVTVTVEYEVERESKAVK